MRIDAGGGGGGSGIDTEIKGEPGQIERAGGWLTDQLAPKVDAAADRTNDARRLAQASWTSTAGDGFASSMRRAGATADDLQSQVKGMGHDLDHFASALRRCQSEMSDVRKTASSKGLTVAGFVIQDPGPGPTRPSMPPPGATDAQVRAHNDLVEVYNAHQKLIEAFNHAASEAGRVDRQYNAACQSLQHQYEATDHAAYLLSMGDVLGETAAAGVAAYNDAGRSKLLLKARDLYADAQRAADDMLAHPELYTKRRWLFFKQFDDAKYAEDLGAIQSKAADADRLLHQADDIADSKVPRNLKYGGKFLGGLGVGLGLYSDLHDGESTTQALVSQGGGLGASILAGAAIGTAIPVPVVGTAVGAIGGAVVGILADGAIDSLFENGPDVGAAVDEAVDSLKDTGSAIKDGISSVGSAIGGLFD